MQFLQKKNGRLFTTHSYLTLGFMLKRHKASVHGIIPTDAYQCEHCPMFFMKLQAKEKHIEKNHKNETSSIK